MCHFVTGIVSHCEIFEIFLKDANRRCQPSCLSQRQLYTRHMCQRIFSIQITSPIFKHAKDITLGPFESQNQLTHLLNTLNVLRSSPFDDKCSSAAQSERTVFGCLLLR